MIKEIEDDKLDGAALGIIDKMEAWLQPPLLIPRHGPRMKELGPVILTCSFLSPVELAGKYAKVLIVPERHEKTQSLSAVVPRK